MEIKKRRLELKMSQVTLAKSVGVSVRTIQVWEQGVGTPTPENMKKLKEVLQLD